MKATLTRMKTTIKIAVRDDSGDPCAPLVPKLREAEVHGEFAIWRIPHGWNITHVRTGLRLFNVVGSKARALRAIEILQEDADWAHGEFGRQVFTTDKRAWARATHRAAEFLYPRTQRG